MNFETIFFCFVARFRINFFAPFTEKYEIETPTILRKNIADLPKTWSRYQEQLREVDDNLYNLKEQFKTSLVSPRSPVEEVKSEIVQEEEVVDDAEMQEDGNEENGNSEEAKAEENVEKIE